MTIPTDAAVAGPAHQPRQHAPVPHARRAARQATHRNSVRIPVPLVGDVHLPRTDELAYLGGVAALAALGLLEWPIAGALAAGHMLATNKHNKVLHDFGAALEEA